MHIAYHKEDDLFLYNIFYEKQELKQIFCQVKRNPTAIQNSRVSQEPTEQSVQQQKRARLEPFLRPRDPFRRF
jgi:hypothetical protein